MWIEKNWESSRVWVNVEVIGSEGRFLPFARSRFVWWLQMIPFVVFFVVFDEMRRYMIRRYPHGFCEQNFYF